jgi:hypothetical protein
MAISDSQKVDYLWKKLGYAAAKTDTNANKKAPNEAIASPLLLRGDNVWALASDIPGVQPAATTGVTTVYPTSLPQECTMDNTATTNRTWKTGLTDWISPEFGASYQVKVYIHTSGNAANAAASGTQVFATGSGNDDEWFFDYQAGVLHFIGSNLPSGVSFTGKSVYIAGSRYTGDKGVSLTGDFTFSNNQMSVGAGDPIVMDNTTGLVVPTGSTAQRNGTPTTGELRYNTSTSAVEIYDGSSWASVGNAFASITSQTLNGDGSTITFTLNESTTAASIIVNTNGVVQQPGQSYTVSGNQITFAEAPVVGDRIDVRFMSEVTTVSQVTGTSGSTYVGVIGNSVTMAVDGTTVLQVTSNDIVNISSAQCLQLPAYTTSAANSLTNVAAGQVIYVTNGDSGSPCLAVYDGSNWKRVVLGSAISSS